MQHSVSMKDSRCVPAASVLQQKPRITLVTRSPSHGKPWKQCEIPGDGPIVDLHRAIQNHHQFTRHGALQDLCDRPSAAMLQDLRPGSLASDPAAIARVTQTWIVFWATWGIFKFLRDREIKISNNSYPADWSLHQNKP